MSKKNPLRGKIEAVLFKYPFTRNDDVILMLYLWREYYPTRIQRTKPTEAYKDGRAFVYISDIPDLPREDHIKRIRARIQNVEHLFLPTDHKVAEHRFRNIENWREVLGYQDDSYKRI